MSFLHTLVGFLDHALLVANHLTGPVVTVLGLVLGPKFVANHGLLAKTQKALLVSHLADEVLRSFATEKNVAAAAISLVTKVTSDGKTLVEHLAELAKVDQPVAERALQAAKTRLEHV